MLTSTLCCKSLESESFYYIALSYINFFLLFRLSRFWRLREKYWWGFASFLTVSTYSTKSYQRHYGHYKSPGCANKVWTPLPLLCNISYCLVLPFVKVFWQIVSRNLTLAVFSCWICMIVQMPTSHYLKKNLYFMTFWPEGHNLILLVWYWKYILLLSGEESGRKESLIMVKTHAWFG